MPTWARIILVIGSWLELFMVSRKNNREVSNRDSFLEPEPRFQGHVSFCSAFYRDHQLTLPSDYILYLI